MPDWAGIDSLKNGNRITALVMWIATSMGLAGKLS